MNKDRKDTNTDLLEGRLLIVKDELMQALEGMKVSNEIFLEDMRKFTMTENDFDFVEMYTAIGMDIVNVVEEINRRLK